MSIVKSLLVKLIDAKTANEFVSRVHYSGKVVPNSQIHFGVFFNKVLQGVMQFGPSMMKNKSIGLVTGTGWNDFIELNRMAFTDVLPKNSESRALGIAIKMIKKQYPNMKWIITFADGTQCGDGTIYRATGFLLTQIKKNTGLRRNPKTGEVLQTIAAHHRKIQKEFSHEWIPLEGYQFRYVKFLDESFRKNLNSEVLDYSEIKRLGVSMYRGERGV